MTRLQSHLHQLKVSQMYHNVNLVKVKLKVKLSLKQTSLKIKQYYKLYRKGEQIHAEH